MASMSAAHTAFTRTVLELLAGAPERAEHAARAGLRPSRRWARNQGSTAAALVGLTLVEQGRDEEALDSPTSPRRGPRPTTPRHRSGSSPSAHVYSPARRARAPGGGARSRCAIEGARRHRYAAMRSSTSRPCWSAPAAPRTRPRAPRRHRALRAQGQRRLRRPRPRDDRAPRTPRRRYRRLACMTAKSPAAAGLLIEG